MIAPSPKLLPFVREGTTTGDAMDRRKLLQWSGAASALGAASTLPERAPAAPGAATSSPLGLDAAQMGVRPGSPDDQSAALQRAIERAAAARVPLVLPPGTYRAGALKLPAGSQLTGFRGATRLVYGGGPSLIGAEHADQIALTGLTIDGMKRALPPHEGLVHFEACRGVRVLDCAILGAGGHGMLLAASEGEVAGTTIADAADVAIFTYDAAGLTLRGKHHRQCGQQRHPDHPLCSGARRHHGRRQPDREHAQPGRRLRAIRQRHQRPPRR
jgi:uncharacterized secreted repeat protein (TIGR03808 family)